MSESNFRRIVEHQRGRAKGAVEQVFSTGSDEDMPLHPDKQKTACRESWFLSLPCLAQF
jgi:hypothetical protein